MNIFKKFYMWFHDLWNIVIDAKYNPLRFIPSLVTQFYITMVLAVGWSVAFGLAMGYYSGIFTSVFVHVGIVFMIFFTASTFKDAERDNKVWWIDLSNEWEALKNSKQREELTLTLERRNQSIERAFSLKTDSDEEETDKRDG
jgi:hypothetical protein